MHNLAIALYRNGHDVSGSDDEIFEPSASRLEEYGLLPPEPGWHPDKITGDIDSVILGMHARKDNPELKRAQELQLEIKSFPEYLYEQTRSKKRVVVGGSHGKTTITSMIMHVLRSCGREFDYMVGSVVEGFDTMVNLSENSEIAVFEGDEYLSSAIDSRSKFHLYKADIAVINGISWDHINVFPSFDTYLEQFRIFTDTISNNGKLIYFGDDALVKNIAETSRGDIKRIPYTVHGYFQNSKGFFAATHNRIQKMEVFGEHNMQNMSAARIVCEELGISDDEFYNAIGNFRGSGKRLQLLNRSDNNAVYLDFAHAPTKVRATVEAVAERYPGYRLIACLELHTYSSLNEEFIKNYKNSLSEADLSFVYYNPHALKIKKMKMLNKQNVKKAFGNDKIAVLDDSDELFYKIKEAAGPYTVYLFMSSGDFNGYNINDFASGLISQ